MREPWSRFSARCAQLSCEDGWDSSGTSEVKLDRDGHGHGLAVANGGFQAPGPEGTQGRLIEAGATRSHDLNVLRLALPIDDN
jgi:hypothetical protein